MSPIVALYDNWPDKAERIAVIDGDLTLNHAQLIATVEAASADLTARGLAGRRVALMAANGWRHLVAYLAILHAGAVWVPLNPKNGAALNRDLIARAQPDLVIADAGSVDIAPDAVSLEDWLPAVSPAKAGAQGHGQDVGQASCKPSWTPAFARETEHEDRDFAIKFTGGTTGRPKGVVQSVRSAAAAMASMQAHYGFSAEDVNLIVAPLTHGAAHYVLPVLAAGGAHLILAEPSRPAILEALRADTSIAFMPPTLIYLLMAEAAFGPGEFPRLRRLTYSAAPMPPTRIGEVIERFGPVLDTLYGQTEAPMTATALTPAEMADPDLRATVGRPFADTPVRLLTDDGAVAGRGEGEVLIGGDLAATRYLDDSEATTGARHDGWLKTGDIGRIGADGRLTLIGRAREMIISGGYNLYPAEADAAMLACPGVIEACAFGLEDPVWGERLEAAVVLAPSVDPAEVMSAVRARLGPIRAPKALHPVASLPRNPVGKVVRGDVRRLIQSEPTQIGRPEPVRETS